VYFLAAVSLGVEMAGRMAMPGEGAIMFCDRVGECGMLRVRCAGEGGIFLPA
jgi:hypothetical protein